MVPAHLGVNQPLPVQAVGRAIMADARGKTIEVYDFDDAADKPAFILKTVKEASDRKKAYSQQMHDKLVKGQTA